MSFNQGESSAMNISAVISSQLDLSYLPSLTSTLVSEVKEKGCSDSCEGLQVSMDKLRISMERLGDKWNDGRANKMHEDFHKMVSGTVRVLNN